MGNPPSSGHRTPRPGGAARKLQALALALLHWILEGAIESQQPTRPVSLHPPDEADDIMQETQNDHLGVSSVVIQETLGGKQGAESKKVTSIPSYRELNISCT